MSDQVSPGQRIRGHIKAEAWNDMLAAAADFKRRRLPSAQFDPDMFDQSPVVGQLFNETGADLPRGSIVATCDVWHKPSADLDQFQNEYIFCGRVPEIADRGRFFVVKEPIRNNEVGEIVMAGVAATQVNVSDETHLFAERVLGNVTNLQSASAGSARILWIESGIGLKWGYVRLGDGGESGANTTSTTTPAPHPQPCAGKCRYVWDQAQFVWVLDPEQSQCGTTTSTTTPAPGGSGGGSFGASSFAAFSFAANSFQSSEITVTSSTTAKPKVCCTTSTTTSTTPAPIICQCNYPTFCGTDDGECTFTFCAQYPNNSPACQSTTSSTTPAPGSTTSSTTGIPGSSTSTTTYNCNLCTSTTIGPCASPGCDWASVPVVAIGCQFTYAWQQVTNDCDGPGCAGCPDPNEPPTGLCQTTHTACMPVVTTTTGRPAGPTCGGTCLWYCSGGGWSRVIPESCGECSATPEQFISMCYCDSPSDPPPNPCCGFTVTSCSFHVPNTTLPPPTLCEQFCGTSSTTPNPDTSTTSSTTTAAPGCVGNCKHKWSTATNTWTVIQQDCTSACPCLYPAIIGMADCEVTMTKCGPESTTTSTTPGPTTSTTPGPTTSTTSTTPGPTQYVCMQVKSQNPGGFDCLNSGGRTGCNALDFATYPTSGFDDTQFFQCGPSYSSIFACIADCVPGGTTTTPAPTTTAAPENWYCRLIGVFGHACGDGNPHTQCIRTPETAAGAPICGGPWPVNVVGGVDLGQLACMDACNAATTTPSP